MFASSNIKTDKRDLDYVVRALKTWTINISKGHVGDKQEPFLLDSANEDATIGLMPITNGILSVGDAVKDKSAGQQYRLAKLNHNLFVLDGRNTNLEYDPVATCPIWLKTLEENLPDPETRRCLQMQFGLMLMPQVLAKSFSVLYGKTDTGKSIVAKVLTHMMGEFCTNLGLHSFGAEFSMWELRGKWGNVIDETDIPRQDVRDSQTMIKQMSGGYPTPITTNRKGRDYERIKVRAKPMFATNSALTFDWDGGATVNRQRVFPFCRQIPKEAQDSGLIPKLLAETPGILNWAIEGACMYMASGLAALPESDEMKTCKAQMYQDADQIAAAIREAFEFTGKPEDRVKSGDAYVHFRNAYENVCSAVEKNRMSEKVFVNKMRELGYEKKRMRFASGENLHGYQGMRKQITFSSPVSADFRQVVEDDRRACHQGYLGRVQDGLGGPPSRYGQD
jgi:phage/plasmid-associated DNA primase